jgi:hypothetical protein
MVVPLFGLSLHEIGWEPFAILVAAFLVGTGVVLFLLVQIPADYLRHGGDWLGYRHSRRGWALLILKNLLGVVLVVAGVFMLVLPGPGVATVVVGLALLDFPGKRRLQWKLLSWPGVMSAVNRLRSWFGKPPLVLDGRDQADAGQQTKGTQLPVKG